MTRKQIEALKAGDLLTDGRGRWVEVADTGRMEQFGDMEVYEMEPNEAGDLVRADWDTFLMTAGELEHWSQC